MPADRYRSELRALGASIIIAVASALGGGMATAQDAEQERELHKLNRSLSDSEIR